MSYKGSHVLREIEILQPKIVFQNKFATLYNDSVIFPGGKQGEYLRFAWNIPTGAAVLPVLPDSRIVLLRTFRHALRSWSLEIPRGFGEEHESPGDTAKRELAEETGLWPLELMELGTITPDSGILNSTVSLFLARVELGITRANKPDDGEAIGEIRVYEFPEVLKMILNGDIVDGYTIAAVFRAILANYLERADRR